MNIYDLGEREVFRKGEDFCVIGGWDLFLSGYNLSERVRYVFENSNAREKRWLIAKDYNIQDEDLPTDSHFIASEGCDEGEAVRGLLAGLGLSAEMRVCVDATGFVRQHLLFLLRYLHQQGIRRFDVLYAEPVSYKEKERTKFSGGAIGDVRQVVGYEGVASKSGRDFLIIGTGYDQHMIGKVAEDRSCRVIQMLGFPPLRADMYQENLIQVSRAEDYTGKTEFIYAPANDPFRTAQVIREEVERERLAEELGNIFLSPLGTKVQVLGFAIYYLCEGIDRSCSIVYPMTTAYSNDTTIGIERVWRYGIDFSWLSLQ